MSTERVIALTLSSTEALIETGRQGGPCLSTFLLLSVSAFRGSGFFEYGVLFLRRTSQIQNDFYFFSIHQQQIQTMLTQCTKIVDEQRSFTWTHMCRSD